MQAVVVAMSYSAGHAVIEQDAEVDVESCPAGRVEYVPAKH